jgi:hypothetical protein
MIKSKPEIVFSALMQGFIVELDSQEIKFFNKKDTFETNLGNEFEILQTGFYVKVSRTAKEESSVEFMWLFWDLIMSNFIEICNKMSEVEVCEISYLLTLKNIKGR